MNLLKILLSKINLLIIACVWIAQFALFEHYYPVLKYHYCNVHSRYILPGFHIYHNTYPLAFPNLTI